MFIHFEDDEDLEDEEDAESEDSEELEEFEKPAVELPVSSLSGVFIPVFFAPI